MVGVIIEIVEIDVVGKYCGDGVLINGDDDFECVVGCGFIGIGCCVGNGNGFV